MAPLLPALTVPNQSGFIKDRLLSDNTLLAQELFHELWKCNPSPNLALKLDLAKAYDHVQWSFLLKVLRKMGFSEMCWIFQIITGADYLSRTLDRLILGNKKMRYCTARYSMEVSHLAYADDIIIFTQARRASLKHLKDCLKYYMEVSGQKINEAKSCFYIDKKHVGWAADVASIEGFQQGSLSCTYLGVPIFRGWKKTNLFMFIQDKFSHKILCWCHRHLSFGGRLTLVKSILEAISVHIFQVLEPTKGALRILEQVLARSSRFSPIWRRMFKAGVKCKGLIRWMLGEGKIRFWDDTWLEYQPISAFCSKAGIPPFVRVNEFWTDTRWKKDDVLDLLDEWGVPREVTERIMNLPINTEAEDIGRCALTPHGNFTVSSAWELIRNKGEKMEVYEFIWGKGISPTISVFLWRFLANQIPVDAKVQWGSVPCLKMPLLLKTRYGDKDAPFVNGVKQQLVCGSIS
ncbi:uncharacterized protein LOC121804041 [Salvia splendens]|uniref:uncharacterized protein LOC121804041 n=1 Tax=Salvia splendens TaxID=180675 RepID=UPI001C27402E|nr:uncharacterized protein LOC121804041 [Salvia splendens]